MSQTSYQRGYTFYPGTKTCSMCEKHFVWHQNATCYFCKTLICKRCRKGVLAGPIF